MLQSLGQILTELVIEIIYNLIDLTNRDISLFFSVHRLL